MLTLLFLFLAAEAEPPPSPLAAAQAAMQAAHDDPDAWDIIVLAHRLARVAEKASPGGDHSFSFRSDDVDLVERLKIADAAYEGLRRAFAPDPKRL